MRDNNEQCCSIGGIVLVGPANDHIPQANPTAELFQAPIAVLTVLRDRLLAILRDAYEMTPIERVAFIERSVAGLDLAAVGGNLRA